MITTIITCISKYTFLNPFPRDKNVYGKLEEIRTNYPQVRILFLTFLTENISFKNHFYPVKCLIFFSNTVNIQNTCFIFRRCKKVGCKILFFKTLHNIEILINNRLRFLSIDEESIIAQIMNF